MAKRENIIRTYDRATEQLFADKALVAEYLEFSGRFYKMPSSQVIMLFDDNPKATMVADYETWKRFGRKVKPGGWSTDVLSDGEIKRLFDISMTKGDTIPYQWSLNKKTAEEFVKRLSSAENRNFTGMSDCIYHLAVNSVMERIQDIKSSLDIMDINVDDEATFRKSFASMVRRVVAARCEWNSDFTYGGTRAAKGVDLSALDLLKNSGEMETLLEEVQITAKNVLKSMEKSINDIIFERSIHNERNERVDRTRENDIGRGSSPSVVRGGEAIPAVDNDAERKNVQTERGDVRVRGDDGAISDGRGAGTDERADKPLGQGMADVYDGELPGGYPEAAGQNVVGTDTAQDRPGGVGDLGENTGGVSDDEPSSDHGERDSLGGAAESADAGADTGKSGERAADSALNNDTAEEISPAVDLLIDKIATFEERLQNDPNVDTELTLRFQTVAQKRGEVSYYPDLSVRENIENLINGGGLPKIKDYLRGIVNEALTEHVLIDEGIAANEILAQLEQRDEHIKAEPEQMRLFPEPLTKKQQAELDKLTADLSDEFARWEKQFLDGGSDAYYEDGVGLSLIRNHIIYDKHELEDKFPDNLPDIYHKETPPEYPNNYQSVKKGDTLRFEYGDFLVLNIEKTNEYSGEYSVQLQDDNGEVITQNLRDIKTKFRNLTNRGEVPSRADVPDITNIPSDLDKIYVDKDSEIVRMVYYNPDSSAGGQLVYNEFDFDDIFAALGQNDPMDFILSSCKQTAIDVDMSGFDAAVREFLADTEDFNSRDERYLDKLFALPEPTYSILQLKDGADTRDYRFAGMAELSERGLYVDRENYSRVYRGRLKDEQTLENIYTKFNVDRPSDFYGHSLSTGDVIGIVRDGKPTAYYIDSVGFEEIPDFLLSREERKARRTLTDNLVLIAENQLASDEMDTLGDKLFDYENAPHYKGNGSHWLIGNGMTADEFEAVTTRYHNGEDVRAELAKGMYTDNGELNAIEFFGDKDGIGYVNVITSHDENGMTFKTKGGFEITYSWEQLGDAMINAAKKEFDRHEALNKAYREDSEKYGALYLALRDGRTVYLNRTDDSDKKYTNYRLESGEEHTIGSGAKYHSTLFVADDENGERVQLNDFGSGNYYNIIHTLLENGVRGRYEVSSIEREPVFKVEKDDTLDSEAVLKSYIKSNGDLLPGEILYSGSTENCDKYAEWLRLGENSQAEIKGIYQAKLNEERAASENVSQGDFSRLVKDEDTIFDWSKYVALEAHSAFERIIREKNVKIDTNVVVSLSPKAENLSDYVLEIGIKPCNENNQLYFAIEYNLRNEKTEKITEVGAYFVDTDGVMIAGHSGHLPDYKTFRAMVEANTATAVDKIRELKAENVSPVTQNSEEYSDKNVSPVTRELSIGDQFRNTATGEVSKVTELTGALPWYTDDCTVVRESGEFIITENIAKSDLLNAEKYEFIGSEKLSTEEMMADFIPYNEKKVITATMVGDFYEFYGDDAKELSKKFNLALTTRGGKPMVGVPQHRFDDFCSELYDKGYIVENWQHYQDVIKPHVEENPSMARAETLINEFCESEYESEGDFTNKLRVGLAYTDDEQTGYPIEVYADLEYNRIITEFNGVIVSEDKYKSLDEMCDLALEHLDFDDLVYLSDEKRHKIVSSVTQSERYPTITCEWSESPVFEDGKTYSVAEFDRLMKRADDEHIAGKKAALQKYGTSENWINSNDEEFSRFIGYDKVKFTLTMPDGTTYTERQDIGDGYGGVIDFLSQYPKYNKVIPLLEEAREATETNSFRRLKARYSKIKRQLDELNSAVTPVLGIISDFRAKTDEHYKKIAGYSAHDAEEFAKNYIREAFKENEISADVGEVVLYGSRSRGTEHDASDLDFVAEIRSDMKEDALFNILHETTFEIGGAAVDINPIRAEETGGLEDYLLRAEQYMLQKYAKAENTPEVQDYRIEKTEQTSFGPKAHCVANVTAIKTLRQIEDENRPATPEEQKILAQYVGWGGIPQVFDSDNAAWSAEYSELKELLTPDEYEAARSTVLTAHYTSPTIISAIYSALDKFGFKGGNVLEPAMGIGNFFGVMPEEMRSQSQMHGVELDDISGRIAKQLYPSADIQICGYENTAFSDNFFDAAIGNVPFGNYGVSDARYNRENFLIHDYFFAKTLDKVAPGGVVAFITSKGTLDKTTPKVREYLAKHADLLGAIRLPNNAFKANAGTEVTADIIFLQKREKMSVEKPDWCYTAEIAEGISVNQYFVDHPEMILGEMKLVSGRYGEETACVPTEGAELKEQLESAVARLRRDVIVSRRERARGEEHGIIPASADVRNFTFTEIDNKIYFRENNIMREMPFSKRNHERMSGMIGIRSTFRELVDAQAEGCTDETLGSLQARLNAEYDAFVMNFGHISDIENRKVFAVDDDYNTLCGALELIDPETKSVAKADIFTKRTIKPYVEVTRVDTPQEALFVSLDVRGMVDIEYMAELCETSNEDVIRELTDGGFIYKNPETEKYEEAAEYLSGYVREKLRQAQDAAAENPEYERNVAALEKALPQKLGAGDISVRLGAPWITIKDYCSFFKEYAQGDISETSIIGRDTVLYRSVSGEYKINNKNTDKSVAAQSSFGTKRMNSYAIFENLLNNRDIAVYDSFELPDGKKKRVMNKDETQLAQEKARQMKEAFPKWLWSDQERREKYVEIYNELFNSLVGREYDGSHQTFPGMNPFIELTEHQKNAVMRCKLGGNTLLAHCVGAGKTFEMAAAVMEKRRLGLINKACIVVPKHLVGQMSAEWLRLYPEARLLTAKENDFNDVNRQKFIGRCCTGDYDAVVMSYQQFQKIPMSVEYQQEFLTEQLKSLTEQLHEFNGKYLWADDKRSVKDLEHMKKNIETKLKKLLDTPRDNSLSFEQLGFDCVVTDEAHNYKNGLVVTKMKNVSGIGSKAAKKSEDFLMKTRYLNEKFGERNLILASGTPVSNSMTELYIMQQYLKPSALLRQGLQNFDDWASTFGEVVSQLELKPAGDGFRMKKRFAKFTNLPELMQAYKDFADIRTAEMLNLPVPEIEGGKPQVISAKPNEFQQAYMKVLAERSEAIHNGNIDPSVDNMLRVTNEARLLGLDARTINPDADNYPDSKVNLLIAKVMEIYTETTEQKGVQAIFCDIAINDGKKDTSEIDVEVDDGESETTLSAEEQAELLAASKFSVYKYVKEELIRRGIPESEICFAGDAKNQGQRGEMYAQLRAGTKRIVLASTTKMGTGANIQTRLCALHNLDIPWKPSDVDQTSRYLV